MFHQSWKLLVEGSLARPALVPQRLWRRVQAPGSLPPFFVWVVDEEIRAALRRELARATWSPAIPEDTSRPLVVEPTMDHAGAPAMAAAGVPTAAPTASDLVPGRAMPAPRAASLRPSLQTEQPSRRVDRKVARERARRLQVPASVLNLLAKEYQVNLME